MPGQGGRLTGPLVLFKCDVKYALWYLWLFNLYFSRLFQTHVGGTVFGMLIIYMDTFMALVVVGSFFLFCHPALE